MFERFTERARQVVVFAQDEARSLRHNYIGTEHILLGLLREEEGLAARVLDSLDVTAEEVRAHVGRIVGEGDEVVTGQIPFTPRARRTLELALREALQIGHNYIGTEHILLGLVHEQDGVGALVLRELGVDSEMVTRHVVDVLAGSGERESSAALGARLGPPRPQPRARAAPGPPRFARDVRHVLAHAQQEARALGADAMGTDHVLLGLLRDEQGLAARLLDALGVTLAEARAQVARTGGPAGEPATGHIRFTPEVRQVLERARREASALQCEVVGTEHVLLGLLREAGGLASRILRDKRC
jgi:ATP-dependent Clp protease ATP-binding subunit ClpA